VLFTSLRSLQHLTIDANGKVAHILSNRIINWIKLTPISLESVDKLQSAFPDVPKLFILFAIAVSSGNWRKFDLYLDETKQWISRRAARGLNQAHHLDLLAKLIRAFGDDLSLSSSFLSFFPFLSFPFLSIFSNWKPLVTLSDPPLNQIVRRQRITNESSSLRALHSAGAQASTWTQLERICSRS